MECQAEAAAALLPSFRELTSAGVVGRDRNGSPSDGSTDGSQQSQVFFLFLCFLIYNIRMANWLPIPESILAARVDPVTMEISYDLISFFWQTQLSSTSESSSPEQIKELRLSSAHAMIFLSQQVCVYYLSLNNQCISIMRNGLLTTFIPWNRNGIRQTKSSLIQRLRRNRPATRQMPITWCWSNSKIRHTVFISQYAFN